MSQETEQYDLVLRGERVLTPEGIAAREVGVRDGVIVAVEPLGAGLSAENTIEVAADEILLPGLVDSHVHVNEPGRTEWEGFASATRAAAAGGVTTIVDMPLNSIPPTVDLEALRTKQDVARDQVHVDVGFWGGAVPGNTGQLRPLHEAGVFGFKCFLLDSGVPEFPPLGLDEIEADLTELKSFDSLLIVHAEDPHVIEDAPQPDGPVYSHFLASRPRSAEDTGIADVIERARRTGARAHILHLSSSDALGEIRDAKAEGVRLTVETCPHYLVLTAEEIPDGATAFKCCPPIRESGNQDLLWEGIADGTIDLIVSDHSPATVELKHPDGGGFDVAWGGISSLQLGLSLVWTEAQKRGIALERIVELMSAKPAALIGLQRKGSLAVGKDADFAVFAPEQTYTVAIENLLHKNPVSAYAGRELTGQVRATYLRGEAVDRVTPRGRLLAHGED
ncbi:MAG: allantoinase AllB [Actinobacteria bacterium]|nr:allantoinase AllB [Actinomycetota bacterium]